MSTTSAPSHDAQQADVLARAGRAAADLASFARRDKHLEGTVRRGRLESPDLVVRGVTTPIEFAAEVHRRGPGADRHDELGPPTVVVALGRLAPGERVAAGGTDWLVAIYPATRDRGPVRIVCDRPAGKVCNLDDWHPDGPDADTCGTIGDFVVGICVLIEDAARVDAVDEVVAALVAAPVRPPALVPVGVGPTPAPDR